MVIIIQVQFHYHLTLAIHCHKHSLAVTLVMYTCSLIIMAVTEYSSSLPRGNTVNQMARQPQSLV